MTEGQIKTQLDLGWRVLQRLGLASYRVYFPDYASTSAAQYRKMRYLDEWKFLITNQLFNYQLNDDALIQFKFLQENGSDIVSYAYYENPYPKISYREFLDINDLNYREIGQGFVEEYHNYLENSPLKDAITPTRYDFSPNQYVEGRHPASHFHFGHRSEIRVATNKVLEPLSFMLFVMRQYYPDSWQQFCSGPIPKQCARSIRNNLQNVHRRYVNAKDQYEMFLG